MTVQTPRAVGVIGAGHSGTTIIYRMLALHPDASWFSQYSRRALLGPRAARAMWTIADRGLRRVKHDWAKVQHASGWRRLIPIPIEGAGLWDHAMEGGGEESLRRIDALFAAMTNLAGGPVMLIKPPGRYRSRCAPLVSAASPQSRYLHVARDGRAVALSVFAKWLRSSPHDRGALLANASEHWRRALRQVQEYEGTLPVAVIHYEAFCADVRGQVRRALEFAGMDPNRFPYDRVPTTLRSTNEARFRRADPEDLAALTRLLADDLRRYGYAPDHR